MGVSFQELILLMLIGLIVLGPERLPRLANQLGHWLGQARRMTRVMKRQLEDELNLDRQYDMLPAARTRHSTPGSYSPPAPPPAESPTPDAKAGDEETDDTYSPAHGPEEPGTGVGADEPEDDRVTTTDAPDVEKKDSA